MNERIEHCLYQSGLTAQECWDELDDYAKQGIEKFAELIVRECMREAMEEIVADEEIIGEPDRLIKEYLLGNNQGIVDAVVRFRNHFGIHNG